MVLGTKTCSHATPTHSKRAMYESIYLKGCISLSYDLYMHIIISSKEPFYQGFCWYTFEHILTSWYTLNQGFSLTNIIGILEYSFEHIVISWYTRKLLLLLLFLDMISSFLCWLWMCILLAHQKSLSTKFFWVSFWTRILPIIEWTIRTLRAFAFENDSIKRVW